MSIVISSDILGESITIHLRGLEIGLSLDELEQIVELGQYTLDAIEEAINQPEITYDHLSRAH